MNDKNLGTLSFDGQLYYFQYDKYWLDNGFKISPDFPLEDNIFKSTTLFNCFLDASPDSWGQRVLQVAENLSSVLGKFKPKLLNDWDYFKRTSNFIREGSIDVVNCYTEINHNDSIENLITSCTLIEEGKSSQDYNAIFKLIKSGVGTGGARPKFNIVLNDELWICKCKSFEDIYNETGFEAVNLSLAQIAGLNVPDFTYDPCLNLLSIKRFDRNKSIKIPYISARTMLNINECSYPQIASFCSDDDKIELFKRMCLNVLVGNYDDHLRNHGFLYHSGSWKLSPLFDVQTLILDEEYAFHATELVDGNNSSRPELLFQQLDAFNLSTDDATDIFKNLQNIVANNWLKLAENYKLNDDIPLLQNTYQKFIDFKISNYF